MEDNKEEIVEEKVIEKPVKKVKKTIKSRQLGRIRRYVPEIDEDDVSILLDDPIENKEDLRLTVLEHDKDPKEVFNNPVFPKKLIKYINEFKEETVDDINDVIEEAKEEINEAVDDILEDKKIQLFESMLSKFELLIELMSSKINDLDKIKDKYDDMVDDMENKIVESKPIKKEEVVVKQDIPSGLIRMLRR